MYLAKCCCSEEEVEDLNVWPRDALRMCLLATFVLISSAVFHRPMLEYR